MSSPEIEAIRARLEAATSGPWEWEPETDGWGDCGPNLATVAKLPPYKDGSVSPAETVIGSWGHDANGISVNPADADLIAHAPTDIARLLAAIEAVQQECHAFKWNLEDTADSAANHILNTLETALKKNDTPAT